MDDSDDAEVGDKDKDKKQGSTWGSLFAGAGQVGRSGGMSPTRSSEVKKAIRAAMAFGLPKGAGAGAGAGAGGKESGKSSPTCSPSSPSPTGAGAKDDGPLKGGADKGRYCTLHYCILVAF